MVTEEEKREIIREYQKNLDRKLSERMAKIGRSRSAKKRKATRKNIKIAQAVRFVRPRPK